MSAFRKGTARISGDKLATVRIDGDKLGWERQKE